MTRPSHISALLLSLEALALPRVAPAQQPERLQLSATGGAYLLAPGAFAQAFNHGPSLGLMTTVHLVGRLSVRATVRSEEHTSELQSRVDLVCRLLLEK